MAYQRLTLVVLTLLQLCRAETPENKQQDSWYAVNDINDGLQPKPISEIFTTEVSFSANPIVVKSTSSASEEIEPSSKMMSTTSVEDPSSSGITKDDVLPLSGTTPQTPYQQNSPPFPVLPHIEPKTLEQVQQILQSPTFQRNPSSEQIDKESPQSSYQPQPLPPFQNQPDSPQKSTTLPQPVSTTFRTTNPLRAFKNVQYQQSTTKSLPPNYFVIYQAHQPFPLAVPQPPFAVTGTITTGRHASVTPRFTLKSSPTPARPITQTKTTSMNASTTKVTTPIPKIILTNATDNMYPLKIRVIAPSGSITNVNINPKYKPTTTKRPTTTKTRKTPKPKRNNYSSCIDGCNNRKDPICATPMTVRPVDPNTLKGFPSVCHMACHNSFRKESYEKLADGRCGKLRNKIKSIDSGNLKRDELNKSSYTVDNSVPKTVVEFSGSIH